MILGFALAMGTASSIADTQASGQADPSEDELASPTLDRKTLDESHEFISRRVEEYSRRLDDLLGDPYRDYDSTGSTLRLRAHSTFFEAGRTQGRVEARGNLILPNTQGRLKLILERGLEAATETAAERDIKESTGSDQVTAPGASQDDSYYLGLKYKTTDAFGSVLSAEGGAKFGTPLNTYVRFRAFRDFAFAPWSVRVSETPLWRRSEGSSAASEIDLHRPLWERWLFRSSSKATWRSSTNYFELAQIGSIHFTPDKRSTYAFELGVFEPSERSLNLRVFSVAVRARRLIHRDWLYLELLPQILYQEASGYRADYSFTIQLEGFFGDRYLPGQTAAP